jgi:hypothetical protein
MSDIGTPEPSWNPDAHLDRVYRRGRRLRARRRIGVLAGGSLAVVALVAVVAYGLGLAGGGADHGRRVATGRSATSVPAASAGSPGSGGLASPGAPGGDGSGAVGAGGLGAGGLGVSGATGAGGVGGGGSPATLGGGSGPSAGAGGGVTPTSAPGHVTTNTTSATTIAPSTTTTTPRATATTAPAADCGPGDLAYSTATNRNRYAVGAAVDVSLVVRNVSGHTCVAPSIAGVGAKATITGSGAPVTTHGPAISCTAGCQPSVLAPGQSTAYSAGSWSNAGRGTFQAVASRLGRSGTAASFKVG